MAATTAPALTIDTTHDDMIVSFLWKTSSYGDQGPVAPKIVLFNVESDEAVIFKGHNMKTYDLTLTFSHSVSTSMMPSWITTRKSWRHARPIAQSRCTKSPATYSTLSRS